jgi:hypothetical protein
MVFTQTLTPRGITHQKEPILGGIRDLSFVQQLKKEKGLSFFFK